MKPRHKRLLIAACGVVTFGGAAALVLNALDANVMFFLSPQQALAAPPRAAFRLGGLVEAGSLRREADGLTVHFVVTDRVQRIPVQYRGLLPDLFREDKGVVVAGRLRPDGSFHATEVLAKHDENYMPPPAAAALEQGQRGRPQP
jgi:cytochrome c-type biogenesis protein CcmE